MSRVAGNWRHFSLCHGNLDLFDHSRLSILYYTILYYTILYYTIYYNVLYYAILRVVEGLCLTYLQSIGSYSINYYTMSQYNIIVCSTTYQLSATWHNKAVDEYNVV